MSKSKILPISLSFAEPRTVFAGLMALSFSVSFLLHDSQFITGSLVNTALYLAALYLPRKYWLPVAIFPSLGAFSRGLLFGSLTPFLLYMIPFIWLSNLTLMIIFSKTTSFSRLVRIILSALAKYSILLITVNLLFKLSLVPLLFLTVMGTNQLITSLLGGSLALLIVKYNGKKES